MRDFTVRHGYSVLPFVESDTIFSNGWRVIDQTFLEGLSRYSLEQKICGPIQIPLPLVAYLTEGALQVTPPSVLIQLQPGSRSRVRC